MNDATLRGLRDLHASTKPEGDGKTYKIMVNGTTKAFDLDHATAEDWLKHYPGGEIVEQRPRQTEFASLRTVWCPSCQKRRRVPHDLETCRFMKKAGRDTSDRPRTPWVEEV